MFTRRALLAAPLFAALAQAQDAESIEHDVDGALARMTEGNRRFAASMPQHPDESLELRTSLSKTQHPFATVLACADSRVPPELIFDQGLGDLFVIRVAGNILDDAVIGSIEYAAAHLHVPLVYVLGHERCGAVEAALGGHPEAHIRTLAHAIHPAVVRAKAAGGDLWDNAVRENVRFVVDHLRTSRPLLAELIHAKKLMVAGGYYNLENGLVERIA